MYLYTFNITYNIGIMKTQQDTKVKHDCDAVTSCMNDWLGSENHPLGWRGRLAECLIFSIQKSEP